MFPLYNMTTVGNVQRTFVPYYYIKFVASIKSSVVNLKLYIHPHVHNFSQTVYILVKGVDIMSQFLICKLDIHYYYRNARFSGYTRNTKFKTVKKNDNRKRKKFKSTSNLIVCV